MNQSNTQPDLLPDAHFFTRMKEGHASVQKCNGCERRFFPPRTHCPYCRSDRATWVDMTLSGTVYSLTFMAKMPGRDAGNVLLIDADDGFRLMSTCVSSEAENIKIGARVKLSVDLSHELPRLICLPEM